MSILESGFFLEVSSPGLDRPIKTPADFSRVLGQRVRVIFKEMTGHTEVLTGEIKSVSEVEIELKKSNTDVPVKVSLASIVRAVREIKF